MTKKTRICTSTPDDVFVRGKSLTKELVGKLTFTEMTYFQVTGRMPTKAQTAVLDACLVTLMEHGLTPSALATRLVYGSTPEATQSAIAAGLLAVGSVFVGTVEGCAENLARIVAGASPRKIAEEHRTDKRALAGFGHPVHKPDDPRSPVLLGIADANGISSTHVAALRALASAVDEVYGRHITINATGAIAAVLSDAAIPIGIMRGFAVLARCAGLIGHVAEEQSDPAMRAIWEAAERAVPYADE